MSTTQQETQSTEKWPQLDYDGWKETKDTLHLWTQMVGKIRLALSPPENHFWNVALYMVPTGLTTSPIPYGSEAFSIDFDFLNQQLLLKTSLGEERYIALQSRSVKDMYEDLHNVLSELNVQVNISHIPS